MTFFKKHFWWILILAFLVWWAFLKGKSFGSAG
jgi:hypothetical protein